MSHALCRSFFRDDWLDIKLGDVVTKHLSHLILRLLNFRDEGAATEVVFDDDDDDEQIEAQSDADSFDTEAFIAETTCCEYCDCYFDEVDHEFDCYCCCEFWAYEEERLVSDAQGDPDDDLASDSASVFAGLDGYFPCHPISELEAEYDLDFAGTTALRGYLTVHPSSDPETDFDLHFANSSAIRTYLRPEAPLIEEPVQHLSFPSLHIHQWLSSVAATGECEDVEKIADQATMSTPASNPKKRSIQSFFTQPEAKRAKISPPPLSRPSKSVKAEEGSSEVDHCAQSAGVDRPIKAEDAPAAATGVSDDYTSQQEPPSTHPSYPHPIATLPPSLTSLLNLAPSHPGKTITNRPDLNLIHYTPYIPPSLQTPLFTFLRSQLPFYRVKYTIKRGPTETQINTPRFTTVWGIDSTSYFSPSTGQILDSASHTPVPKGTYKCTPRPIPACLAALKNSAEAATGETFNFVLVNYYADGRDSISYHSDDEAFLGPEPCIASFSLGSPRDFLLRHKDATLPKEARDLKLRLEGGECVLMRGRTQANWLHSIPKRSDRGLKGDRFGGGRINITLRKAVVRGGTGNYYRYNVGDGEVFRWDEGRKEMVVWKG